MCLFVWFPSGSAGCGGDEESGLQCGAAGETLLPSQPVHLPAPQRVQQDWAPGGQGHTLHLLTTGVQKPLTIHATCNLIKLFCHYGNTLMLPVWQVNLKPWGVFCMEYKRNDLMTSGRSYWGEKTWWFFCTDHVDGPFNVPECGQVKCENSFKLCRKSLSSGEITRQE